MKSSKIISIIILSLFISSCIRYSKSKNEAEVEELKEIFDEYSETDEIRIRTGDTIDYANIEISADSIDIKLFDLLRNHEEYSEKKLLENIDIFIKKGANPNALIEYTYSSRKLGTYIPIIKHFYKNKYRTHTAYTTALHIAVSNGNTNIVARLLSHGAKIDNPTREKIRPIDVALRNQDSKMVHFLVDNKCNVKLSDLSVCEDVTLIEYMIELGGDPQKIDVNFALKDKVNLKRLLKLKPNLNNLELDFRSIFADEQLLDLLLENGMSPSVKGSFPDRCSLIFGAIKYGDIKTFKKIEDAGADIHEKCDYGGGESTIQLAVSQEKIEILKYLLSKGGKSNENDWTDKSLLINAVSTNNDQIINILIDAGAKIEYNAYFGKAPLMQAVDYGKFISAQALINKGANVNYTNKYGETCLFIAIKENELPMIKLLVENGAKTNVKYKTLNIVQYAEYNEASPMIVDYLKSVMK